MEYGSYYLDAGTSIVVGKDCQAGKDNTYWIDYDIDADILRFDEATC